jgi:hypothetical protein
LENLLDEDDPWLESSSALHKCLTTLSDERKGTNPALLERLFHSCRLESAVTNECIVLLQEFWGGANDDTVKILLLTIVDRIIDPLIMQKTDPAFIIMYRWLRDQEPLVSPYKRYYALISPMVLVQISGLLRRCKNMSLERLKPIVQNHARAQFEYWEEYSQWVDFYNPKQKI